MSANKKNTLPILVPRCRALESVESRSWRIRPRVDEFIHPRLGPGRLLMIHWSETRATRVLMRLGNPTIDEAAGMGGKLKRAGVGVAF